MHLILRRDGIRGDADINSDMASKQHTKNKRRIHDVKVLCRSTSMYGGRGTYCVQAKDSGSPCTNETAVWQKGQKYSGYVAISRGCDGN